MKTEYKKGNVVSESRKVRKPLMEKKRRARINDSLETLKQILLESKNTLKEASGKAGQRTAKLEKADILEMTVTYLQHLRTKIGQARIEKPSRRVRSPDLRSQETHSQTSYSSGSCSPGSYSPEPHSPGSYSQGSHSPGSHSTGSYLPGSHSPGSHSSDAHSSRSHSPESQSQDSFTSRLHSQRLISPRLQEQVLIRPADSSCERYKIEVSLLPTRLENGDIAFIVPSSLQESVHSTSANNKKDFDVNDQLDVWRPW